VGGPSLGVAGLNGSYPDLNLGTDKTDYQVLAESVFRFEYCYILSDGTYSDVPYLKTHTALNGWQDVVAIYVAIAVLDSRNRLLAANGGANPNLSTAITQLKDFNGDPLSPATYPPVAQWEAVVNQANFSSLAHLPAKAAAAVRIYARSIPINILPPDQSL
jgi:hypothetical protein